MIIECLDRFNEITKFAETNNCKPALDAALARVSNMCGEGEIAYLHGDFAPYSFCFCIERTGKRVLVGGIIYSGPGVVLDGSAPTYTVSVEPHSTEHRWSVHT